MRWLPNIGIACVLLVPLVALAAPKHPRRSGNAPSSLRAPAVAQACNQTGAKCVSGATACTDSYVPTMTCSNDSSPVCVETCGQLTCTATQVCDYWSDGSQYLGSGNCVNPCKAGSCAAGLGCCPTTGDCVKCKTQNADGTCCIRKTCGTPGLSCGAPADGCGGNLNCGACAKGFCLNGNCVDCQPGQTDTSGCQQGDCNTSASPASRTCIASGQWGACTNQLVSSACSSGAGAGPGCSGNCTCTGRQCPGGACSVQGVVCNPACGPVQGSTGPSYDVQCNGSTGCAPCSASAPVSCQTGGCAGFQCGSGSGCQALEKHTSWTAASVNLTKTLNDKDGQWRCKNIWTWNVPQPPASTAFSIDIKGWETNCSTTGTSFIVQATCSSFFSAAQCSQDTCCAPCGNVANIHQDKLQLWDVNDLRNQQTWTLTCPHGDAVVLTKLGQTGSNGNGCIYELQVTKVYVNDYCTFDPAQSQYLCGR